MRTSVGPTPHSSVLCAVDFSRSSRDVLHWAARVARARGSTLTALYVNDPLLVAAAAAAYDKAALGAASEQELTRFVARTLGAPTMRTLGVRVRTALGRPGPEILKVADTEGCDLIVAGTRGLNGARKLLLGSTMDILLQRAPVPVLAVPSPGVPGGPRASAGRGSKIRTIVAGLSLGRSALRDAKAAADVAQPLGAALVLVHVVQRPSAPGWLSVNLAPHVTRDVARASRTLDRLREQLADRRVSTDVRVGRPADVLREAARAHDADLVVMQRRRIGTLFGQPAGSWTYELLCGGTVPVLALPEPRRSRR